MKNRDRQLLESFSDNSLQMDTKFKKHLKEKIMKKSAPQKRSSRPVWQLPALAAVTVAIVLMATILPIAGNNNSPLVKTPLSPQTVSAATIEKKSKEFQASIKNTPFFTSTESLVAGPQYEACSTGMMGIQPGETWTTYAYMGAKNDGGEAFYQKKTAENGTVISSTSFYNSSTSQLASVIDSFNRPFTLSDGYYTVIDKAGKDSPDSNYKTQKVNGKDVYAVYLAVTDRSRTCGNDELVMRYLIDPATYAVVEYAQYRGNFDDEGQLVYRGTIDTTLEELSESQALGRMEKAGFNKATAVSEFPAYIP